MIATHACDWRTQCFVSLVSRMGKFELITDRQICSETFHNFDRGAMLMELLPYLDMMTSIHLSMEVPKSVSLDYEM